ncbi:MAG TPA: SDR family NAD(P)-dependent oxidoreductase, partial [Casimicrobiaceae bacterium]
MRLADKIAIVTGAGSGFGRGIAMRFAAEGAHVVVNDIHEAHGRETVETIGAGARFCAGNVADDGDVKRLVEFALATFGGLTTLVNNAGTTHRNQPLLDVTEAEFDRVYAVNVKSLFLTARHAVPHFRRQGGGAFITIASTAGLRP